MGRAMTDVKLDRKRSYGTVYGDAQVGYIQDNLEFRHDGAVHPRCVPTQSAPSVAPAVSPLSNEDASEAAEPKADRRPPNPERSEAMRKLWAERRKREEAAASTEVPVEEP